VDLARVLAATALAAALFARWLNPALLGSRSGIGWFINTSDKLTALSSQIFMVAGVSLTVTLASRTLRHSNLEPGYRFAAVPIAGAVSVLVVASSQSRLDPPLLVSLAACAALLPLLIATALVKYSQARAVALVLASAGAAAAAHLGAVGLANWTGQQLSPAWLAQSRLLSTLSLGLDALSVLVFWVWIGSPRRAASFTALAALMAITAVVTYGAFRGAEPGAPLWQVLASRASQSLNRAPVPFVSRGAQFVMELVAHLTALGAIFVRHRPSQLVSAGILAILARASTDIPALALGMTIAALLGALAIPIAGSRAA
jgi:hypothetical protein